LRTVPTTVPTTVLAIVLVSLGCATHKHGNGDGGTGDGSYVPDACVGLRCSQVNCEAKGLPATTLSGIVYAPNGTLPLYGVNVYVPAGDPGPLKDGVQCDRCNVALPGDPIAQTKTDESGHFLLPNVPATTDVPVVVQIGKWRRQFKIPNVAACQDTTVPTTNTTLPKNSTEGDLPKIAISTGAADALECLIRKLGIDDKEISTNGQTGKMHLYADPGAAGQGANQFVAGFGGGTGGFANSTTLWNDLNKMKEYDILIFSCEGSPYPDTKPQSAMDAVKAYADIGGRVFMSHWHNYWIEGGLPFGVPQQIPSWASVATWNNSGTTFNTPTDPPDIIDEMNNPKGMSFATWMLDPGVGGSTVRDQIPISQGKQTCTGVDNAKAERWVYWEAGGVQYPQNFQFTTPQEVVTEDRCGKVVFSDMHVASGSTSTPGVAYPGGCSTQPLTSQEKAIAFMFFDIASCVGSIF
jgi:hypothetical protein